MDFYQTQVDKDWHLTAKSNYSWPFGFEQHSRQTVQYWSDEPLSKLDQKYKKTIGHDVQLFPIASAHLQQFDAWLFQSRHKNHSWPH